MVGAGKVHVFSGCSRVQRPVCHPFEIRRGRATSTEIRDKMGLVPAGLGQCVEDLERVYQWSELLLVASEELLK